MRMMGLGWVGGGRGIGKTKTLEVKQSSMPILPWRAYVFL